MDKSYNSKGFEKAWIKQLKNFNETKIIFAHTKYTTIIKYIDGSKLLGVEIYRSQFEIDLWLNHFQAYLDSGVFDINAYWIEYTTVRNPDNSLTAITRNEIYIIPMKLENQLWNVNSKKLSDFMRIERKNKGDIGFKQVARP